MKTSVLIWSESIHDITSGKLVGGLGVQLMHWANQFSQSGYNVYALTPERTYSSCGITYLSNPKVRFISVFLEVYNIVRYLLGYRPVLLIARGAARPNFWLALFSRLTQTKFVYFGASDTDFEIGKELIASRLYRWLHRCALRWMQYIVVQNEKQAELVNQVAPQATVIKIPNIWPCEHKQVLAKSIDCLWIANFRKLKRPEWFIQLAQEHPHLRFVMAGASLDQELYEACKVRASKCHNLDFLGGVSLDQSDELFARSRCYICSSEIEGFPNTFLQAWSNEIPVITSFDPSNLVSSEQLGIVVQTYEELKSAISMLLNGSERYNQVSAKIKTYFQSSHNPEQQLIHLQHFLDT